LLIVLPSFSAKKRSLRKVRTLPATVMVLQVRASLSRASLMKVMRV
jgi:hypothetical protein